jgi:transposase
MSPVSRLEVIQTGSRRRWSLAEKRRIVAESESTAQVSATARRHELLPSQLFTWRRLAREGRLGGDDGAGFAQAVIACEPAAPAAAASLAANRIEIVLADGLRVSVAPSVDPCALARIIGALERR